MRLGLSSRTWFFILGVMAVVLGYPATGELKLHSGRWSSLCALEFSPDGQTLVAGLRDGRSYNEDFHWCIADVGQSVMLFEARSGKSDSYLVQTRYPAASRGIPSTVRGQFFGFSPGGKTLAIAGWDGKVGIWDWRTKHLTQALRSQLHHCTSVVHSSSGRYLIASSSRSGLWIWDVQAPGEGSYADVTCPARQIASAPNTEQVSVASPGCEWIQLLDLATRRSTRINHGMADGACSVAYSPDGHALAIGGFDSVQVWDFDKQSQRFEVAAPTAHGLAFSPDGGILTVAGVDGLNNWSADTGRPAAGVVHRRPTGSLAYSPDGTLLAVGGTDGEVAVIEVGTGHLLWSQHVKGPPRDAVPFTIATGIVLAVLFLLALRHTTASQYRPGIPNDPRGPCPPAGI